MIPKGELIELLREACGDIQAWISLGQKLRDELGTNSPHAPTIAGMNRSWEVMGKLNYTIAELLSEKEP